jgi:ABC-type uncharacterized transport system involved in gliding motility auxiliary subunit
MGNKGLISIGALLAAVAIFFAVNIVAGKALTSARIDLTEGKLHTLSPGSKSIAASLQEPITLTLYLTPKTANDIAPVQAYTQRVKELLAEFARASGGKIRFSTVEPEPFSEAEDKAVAAGVSGMATGTGEDRLYFGLVGTNAVDRTEVIPFFSPQKEEFLEYDVAKLIAALSDKPRKTIGLMSWLPIQGMEQNPMMQGRGGSPPWQIYTRLNETFDVKSVATNVKEIPSEIKTLVIIHPKSMSEATQYAVDQFVLRGGHAVVFVDPICDSDVPPGMNPMQAMQLPKASDLPKLFGAWGVEMEAGKIATDIGSAMTVAIGQQGRPESVPYVAWAQLTRDKKTIAAADPITGQLERLILATPGVLKKKEGASTDVQPLLMTTAKAAEADASLVSFMPDPKKMLADYKPGDKPLWLAVRITGKVKSAFPDGPPKTDPSQPGDKNAAPATPLPHVAESVEPIGVVVVADCDMLADRFWIQESRLGNVLLGYNEISDNGAMAIGAVENLSGSSELMTLRARGKFSRPFTRIEELELAAEQQYRAKEEELQGKLRTAEQKINELQKQRPDAKDSRLLMTPEQQKEIDGFKATLVQTRKELRDVKFNLNKDTRSLQSRLMAINIGLMPAIIAVFAVGLAAYRASRRTADRQAASKG